MKINYLFLFVIGLFISCGGNGKSSEGFNSDELNFEETNSKQKYAEMVLIAVKTSRDKLILNELSDATSINPIKLGEIVGKYSSTFSDRTKFEFSEAEAGKNDDVYDFNWVDKRGRIAYQVSVYPVGTPGLYEIEKIEFRSRIEIIPSYSFPGGEDIDDYKKVVLKE